MRSLPGVPMRLSGSRCTMRANASLTSSHRPSKSTRVRPIGEWRNAGAERGGEAVLRLVDTPFEAQALAQVTGGEHDPVDRRLVEQVRGGDLDGQPGAGGVAGPEDGRGGAVAGGPQLL